MNHRRHPAEPSRRTRRRSHPPSALVARVALCATTIATAAVAATVAIATIAAVTPPQALHAQQVRSAVAPDTILVGDIFYAALRVDVPPGVTLSAPDTLPVEGTVENAGRMRRTSRDLPGGHTEVTLSYPLTAWQTGEHPLPQVTVVLSGPGGIHEVPGAFPSALVISVLPTDTAGVAPRPPKDVLGPSRLLWPWILGAITLIAALVGLIYYRRRRREQLPRLTFDVAHAASPRERALAVLDQIRGQGLVEAGRIKEFYSGTIAALRAFLDEFDTRWGAELTSAELLRACRVELDDPDAAGLEEILAAADQVKFNRRMPAPAEAFAEWEAVRKWITDFRLREPVPVPHNTAEDSDQFRFAPAPDHAPEKGAEEIPRQDQDPEPRP